MAHMEREAQSYDAVQRGMTALRQEVLDEQVIRLFWRQYCLDRPETPPHISRQWVLGGLRTCNPRPRVNRIEFLLLEMTVPSNVWFLIVSPLPHCRERVGTG